MASQISSIVINARDPALVADFWCAVLGWTRIDEEAEEDGVIAIAPADRAWPMIDVVAVPDDKSVVNRLHLDVRADGTSVAAELDRLIGLGATAADVGQPDDVSWAVLADPEGNEFCLLSRTVQELGR